MVYRSFPVFTYYKSQKQTEQERIGKLIQISMEQSEKQSGGKHRRKLSVFYNPLRQKLPKQQFFCRRRDQNCNNKRHPRIQLHHRRYQWIINAGSFYHSDPKGQRRPDQVSCVHQTVAHEKCYDPLSCGHFPFFDLLGRNSADQPAHKRHGNPIHSQHQYDKRAVCIRHYTRHGFFTDHRRQKLYSVYYNRSCQISKTNFRKVSSDFFFHNSPSGHLPDFFLQLFPCI